MTTTKALQNKYIKLYECIREYIWDLDTLELLAHLEDMTFTAFPNLTELNHVFNLLKIEVKPTSKTDENLDKAINAYQDVLNDLSIDTYMRIEKFQEVNV